MDPSTYLAHSGLAALAFFFMSLASSDLAMDFLHTSPTALPRWQKGFGPQMAGVKGVETRAWQAWLRRIVDCGFLIFTLSLPVFAWLPGRYADSGIQLIWALDVLASVVWFAYLVRLARDPRKVGGGR